MKTPNMQRTLVSKFLFTLVLSNSVAFAAESPPRAGSPTTELSGTILFQSVIAELAALRRDYADSAGLYMLLAQNTRDPRYAERAVMVARTGRDLKTALEAARLWNTLSPNSLDSARHLAELIIAARGRLEELEIALARILARDAEKQTTLLQELPAIYANFDDREAAQKSVFRLTDPYLKLAEAQQARAAMLLMAKRNDEAYAASVRALEIRPDYELAAMMRMHARFDQQPAEAMAQLNAFGQAYPKSYAARLAYGRWLISERSTAEAGPYFAKLLADFPDKQESALNVGLLAADSGDYQTAETQLLRLIEAGYRVDLIYLQLGRMYFAKGDLANAELALSKVGLSESYAAARSALAQLQAQSGRIEDARKTLHEAAATDTGKRKEYTVYEAQILREAKREAEALSVLEALLASMPDDADLLYQSALLAESFKQYDVMDKRLRRVMVLRPDHAHAYNALGYSYADRNVKLAEADTLVTRALKLDPEDAAILDSMGWVRFRQGDLPAAEDFLRRAYKKNADPDISAHLGEVLWHSGQQDEARKVWAEGAKTYPDNRTLLETLKRLKIQ